MSVFWQTFALAMLVGAALYGFAFWRGRVYERAVRENGHGGYITDLVAPYDWAWDWPENPATPLNDRLEERL